VATANKVPNDASFQGMKPPFSKIMLRSCDHQTGVWFHRQCQHPARNPDEPRFCL